MSILDNLVDRARKSKLMKKIYLKVFSPYVDLHVRELSLTFDLQPAKYEAKRLNLLVPSISREHVFGGIATAIDYFNRIAEAGGFQKRIIIINAEPGDEEIRQHFPGYRVAVCGEESPAEQQILPCRQDASPYRWDGKIYFSPRPGGPPTAPRKWRPGRRHIIKMTSSPYST